MVWLCAIAGIPLFSYAQSFRIPNSGAQLPGGIVILPDGTVHTNNVTTLPTGEVIQNRGKRSGSVAVPGRNINQELGIDPGNVQEITIQDGRVYVNHGNAIRVIEPNSGNQFFLTPDGRGNYQNPYTIIGNDGTIATPQSRIPGTIGGLEANGRVVDNQGRSIADLATPIQTIQTQVPAISSATAFNPQEFGGIARAMNMDTSEIANALEGQFASGAEQYAFIRETGLDASEFLDDIDVPASMGEFRAFAEGAGFTTSTDQLSFASDLTRAGQLRPEQFEAFSADTAQEFIDPLTGTIDPSMAAEAQEFFAENAQAYTALASEGLVSMQEASGQIAQAINLDAIDGTNVNEMLSNADLSIPDMTTLAATLPADLSLDQLPEMVSLTELRDNIPTDFMENMPLSQAALEGQLADVMSGVSAQANELVEGAMNDLTNQLGDVIPLPPSMLANFSVGGFGDFTGTGGFGGGGGNYDNRELERPNIGPEAVKGAAPSEPMAAKTTRFKSDSDPRIVPVRDLTPWLYKSPMVKNDEDIFEFYSGNSYKFPEKSVYYTNKMIGFTPATEAGDVTQQQTRFAACDFMIEPEEGLPEESQDIGAPYIRAKLDACANLTILNSALYPLTNDQSVLHTANPDLDCQIYEKKPPEEEYEPKTYIEAAWKKLLEDPSYQLRGGDAPMEPSYEVGMSIVEPISMEDGDASRSLTDLYALPYEELFDPSHPYSPRWDYENNERDQYEEDTNSYGGELVYCAGSLDNEIKVDILEFRRAKFEAHIETRLDYNHQCLATGYSNCCRPVFGGCIDLPCAECMAASPSRPPCGTNYTSSYDRLRIQPQYTPTQGYTEAQCDPGDYERETIEHICHDLAKPYPTLNTVKIRPTADLKIGKFANVDEDKTYNEGLGFADYFENRRPYPALPDTGTEAGNNGGRPDYSSDLGSKVAIVGIGREGERCMYGGTGGETSNGLVLGDEPHPILSWTELKLSQANMVRYMRMSCLPRFERLSKTRGTESLLLDRHGVQVPMPINDEGTQHRLQPMPLAWRGYVNNQPPADGEDDSFAYFAGGSGYQDEGFDNAKVGDIAYLPNGGSGEDKPGIPAAGIVSDIGRDGDEIKFVVVQIMDQGKYPDSCGLTDAAGLSPRRFFYKETMPENKDIETFGLTKDCADPLLRRCEMKSDVWNGVKLYRPAEDVKEDSELLG